DDPHALLMPRAHSTIRAGGSKSCDLHTVRAARPSSRTHVSWLGAVARRCMGARSAATPYIVSPATRDQLYRELTRSRLATILARGGDDIMTSKDLERVFDGWNRHDVDALMTFMADDCIFESASGPEPCGTHH